MGGLTPSCCNQATSRHLDQLCRLAAKPYQASSSLSFDAFGFTCCQALSQQQENENVGTGYASSLQVLDEPQTPEHLPMKVERTPGVTLPVLQSFMTPLQKNQVLTERIPKNKQIRKSQRPKRQPTITEPEPEVPEMMVEEVDNFEISTQDHEDGIRDQNNCKSYHKLVKNYLMSKGLDHLFDDYGVSYHTRYYFVVALIFIKYYLHQDFNEAYARIVQKELAAQTRKIKRREALKEKLDKELRIKGKTRSEGDERDVMKKKHALDVKMNHIRVVIHEIEDFSIRSCRAFFSGSTEESLRILYLKDDPVMRKKYYFDSALEVVTKIQSEVRKVTSQRT